MGSEKPNYMDIIGIVNETNRPPGGVRSVVEAAQRTLLSAEDRVLEVGTSTGFTAIDLNAESLAEAERRAEELDAGDNISFEREDATDLPYDEGTFDLVFVGNVTSYVGDTEAALAEYRRVLRAGGFLVALPMYYERQPDDDLLADVREAIGTEIDVTTREYW